MGPVKNLNLLVVRPPTDHVRCRVHQPGGVQRDAVPQDVQAVGVREGLAPEVHGGYGGQDEADQGHQDHVVFLLEGEDRVGV